MKSYQVNDKNEVKTSFNNTPKLNGTDYFVEDINADTENKFEYMIDGLRKKYPQYAEFLQFNYTEKVLTRFGKNLRPGSYHKEIPEEEKREYFNNYFDVEFGSIMQLPGALKTKFKETIANDPNAMDFMYEMTSEIRGFADLFLEIGTGNKYEKDESLIKRLFATKKIAKMLDMEWQVPDVEEAQILEGNTIVKQGVVLSNVKGKTVNSIEATRFLLKKDEDGKLPHDNGQALYSISNLNVLFYLMGRPSGKITDLNYITDSKNPNKVTGFTMGNLGLNTDFAYDEDYEKSLSAGLDRINSITYMPDRTAELIKDIDLNEYRTILEETGMNRRALDQALERLTKLQNRVKNNEIHLVHDWEGVPLKNPNKEVSRGVVDSLYNIDGALSESNSIIRQVRNVQATSLEKLPENAEMAPEEHVNASITVKALGGELKGTDLVSVIDALRHEITYVEQYISKGVVLRGDGVPLDPNGDILRQIQDCLGLDTVFVYALGEEYPRAVTWDSMAHQIRVSERTYDMAAYKREVPQAELDLMEQKSQELEEANRNSKEQQSLEEEEEKRAWQKFNEEKIREATELRENTKSRNEDLSASFDGDLQEIDAETDFKAAVENINDALHALNVTNEYGETETLNELDIAELKGLYDNAIDLGIAFIQDTEENDPAKDSIMSVVDKLHRQYKALNSAVPGMTISEILPLSIRSVDITGMNIETVGNALSSRKKMTITGPDGLPLKGFFTERQTLDSKKAIEIIKTKINKDHPGTETVIDDIAAVFTNDDLSGRMQREWLGAYKNAHKDIPEPLIEQIKDMVEDFMKIKGNYQMLLLDTSSADVDTRNVAMSDVADLFGAGDILARSIPLTVLNNGIKQEGTFMVNAKGEDLYHLKKGDSFLKIKEGYLDKSPALKQISDMQVIDYICGNVDRHEGNMLYQFDDDGKIVGVQGIDHDMSFFSMNDFHTTKFAEIEAMMYISQGMASRLEMIDDDMLKTALSGNGLDDEQINAAVNRMNKIKEAVESGTLTVMPDEEFLNHNLDDFIHPQRSNTFQQIKSGIRMRALTLTEDQKASLPERAVNDRELPDPIDVKNKNVIAQDIYPLEHLLDNMELAEKHVFFGSDKYKKVKDCLKELKGATEFLHNSGKKITDKHMETLESIYDKTVTACNDYLKHKENQGKLQAGGKTGLRISMVRNVMEFCVKKNHVIENAIHPETEEIKKMKQEARKHLIESFTPETAGTLLKQMNEIAVQNEQIGEVHAKVAEQVKTVIEYMYSKKITPEQCGLTRDDILQAQTTIKKGRMANADRQQIKNEQPEQKQINNQGPAIIN